MHSWCSPVLNSEAGPQTNRLHLKTVRGRGSYILGRSDWQAMSGELRAKSIPAINSSHQCCKIKTKFPKCKPWTCRVQQQRMFVECYVIGLASLHSRNSSENPTWTIACHHSVKHQDMSADRLNGKEKCVLTEDFPADPQYQVSLLSHLIAPYS